MLIDPDGDFGGDLQLLENFGHYPECGVALAVAPCRAGHRRVIGFQRDFGLRGGSSDDRNEVVERKCLIEGRETVVAILPDGTDRQAEVDFAKGADARSHTSL